MNKLFEMLARGEVPDFLQVLEALNEVSDIDWDRVETSQESILAFLESGSIPKLPVLPCSQPCEACG